MRSRIAIFEGYQAPFGRHSPRSGYRVRPYSVRPLPRRYVPLRGMSESMLEGFGRRGYYVPPVYGPARPGIDPRPHRGYRVKKMRDTPGMKRAQARMKKAAKKCSRRRKGTFQACMRKALKTKR